MQNCPDIQVRRKAQKSFVSIFWLCLCFWLWHPVWGWSADILDDSRSPRKTYHVQLRWAHHGDAPGRSADELQKLIGLVPNVAVHLNTSRYVGKTARIFLALPNQINGLSSSEGFRLSWKTRGTLYAGSTTPGNRALIYKGPVKTAQIIELFTFTLEVDANRLTGELRYAPVYEIEIF